MQLDVFPEKNACLFPIRFGGSLLAQSCLQKNNSFDHKHSYTISQNLIREQTGQQFENKNPRVNALTK